MSRLTELQVIYVNNDNLLDLSGLQAVSVLSGSPVNTASVTVTLVLSGTATEVSGVTWPLGLTIASSGSGTGEEVRGSRWQTVLPDSLAITAGEHYQAQVDAIAGDGFKAHWDLPVQAKVREA